VTLAMHEAYGVMGIVAGDEAPLLSLLSLALPALAMGNRIVAVPSQAMPLVATELCQVLDTSDVPDGVFNIITGASAELAKTLAEHDEVAALWHVGDAADAAMVEKASAGNLKPVWCLPAGGVNWHHAVQGQGGEYLRRAVQVKNIWIPYGE
jgi:aldehyde dehydrogenase (NAD+)